MTEEHNLRFPGTVNVKLTLDGSVVELLEALRPQPVELPAVQIGETVTPLDDLQWVIEQGIHIYMGLGQDDQPYLRTVPLEGLQAVTYTGPLDHSLHQLRGEIYRQMGGK